jgi:Holliday junction resolvase RusA-like endonuclease
MYRYIQTIALMGIEAKGTPRPRVTTNRRTGHSQTYYDSGYNEYCGLVEAKANIGGWNDISGNGLPLRVEIRVVVAVRESWSGKKKAEYIGKPKGTKPDADNIGKAILDCLIKNDEVVADLRVSKVWGESNYIEVDLYQWVGVIKEKEVEVYGQVFRKPVFAVPSRRRKPIIKEVESIDNLREAFRADDIPPTDRSCSYEKAYGKIIKVVKPLPPVDYTLFK